MTQDDTHFYWKRGEQTPFNSFFSTLEFSCSCGACIDQKIAKDLINKLLIVRTFLNEPMNVHSGYRCQAHQDALKAKGYETAQGVSQHTLGNAADVACGSMGSLLTELKREFTAIGVAKSFIHVDTRPGPHYWSYSTM